MANTHILAIDQGTTSSRAIVFDAAQKPIAIGQQEFEQIFPHSGWVEHDPEAIWQTTLKAIKAALAEAKLEPKHIAAIGITNQRETLVAWNRHTGKPYYNAIVWQDRRTAEACEALKTAGHEPEITAKTGLLLDPYFSASKLQWLLQNAPNLAQDAAKGDALCGTIDCFLIWRLTGGKAHVTDATNASRTMLFNISSNEWDEDLLTLFGVPRQILPEVKDCRADFGVTDAKIFGAKVPILGVAGDQQAASLGQACFEAGMLKATYGTGCFALLNTGNKLVRSQNRLLGTIAYRLDGQTTYALEGSIFIAGAGVQWLRDGLGIINRSSEVEELAAKADLEQSVYLVPAFTGLGAPYWDAEARGALYGLTRATTAADIALATLEAVCFQTHDLLTAMAKDMGQAFAPVLRVDGGMANSDFTMQRLSDLIDAPIERPEITETTAYGAAWLAGSACGLWPDQKGFTASWQLETRFEPTMQHEVRKQKLASWATAVGRTLSR